MIIKIFVRTAGAKNSGRFLLFFFLIALFLSGCAGNTSDKNERLSREVNIEENENHKIYEEDGKDYVQLSEKWNWDKLGEELFRISAEELLICKDNAQNISPETVHLKYAGTFPDDLVNELSKILLQNSKMINQSMTENAAYFEFLEKYGSNEYELIPKDENDICLSSFQYDLKGKKYILNVYDSEGSAGYCYAVLSEKINEEIITIASFDMQNEGRGKVICYEEEFYFIYLLYNYNLKYYDGIYLYRLGMNVEEDNLCIRCVPQEYIWDCKLALKEYDENEIDDYINQIKGELMSGYYVEVGKDISCLQRVDDDSKLAKEFSSISDDQEYYKVDFANIGVPIYYQTTIFTPSNDYLTVHLTGEFYLYDYEKGREIKLFELKTDTESDDQLVQMWFHEINNRIYTFQIYHLDGYNYLLSVRYVAGNDVTIVRQEHIIPRFGFEITEGKKWIAF